MHIKKYIILIASVVFFCCTINATEVNSYTYFGDYNDISEWAREDVSIFVELDIIAGDESGYFYPQLNITRAEVAKMISNSFYDGSSVVYNETYIDVNDDDWFCDYVATVANIMTGDGEKFRPYDNITREEIAVIIDRILHLNSDLNVGFNDENSIATWANDAAKNVDIFGVITSDFDGLFYPKQECSREMVVVILSRALDLYTDATKANITYEVEFSLRKVENYMLKTIVNPEIGSIGGEWAVVGFSINEANVSDDFYADYWSKVSEYVINQDNLDARKFSNKITDVQRIAIAIKASGYDPKNIFGDINLIDYTWNKYEKMPDLSENQQKLGQRQGLNELIYGLINIDLYDDYTYHNANITREEIKDLILEYQAQDGGFSAVKNAEKSDVDYTAMVIYALAKYDLIETENALLILENMQLSSGGFSGDYQSSGDPIENSESLSQVILAFSALEIDIHEYFVSKDKPSPIETLHKYQNTDGGFSHIMGEETDQMATEQAYIALGVYAKLN